MSNCTRREFLHSAAAGAVGLALAAPSVAAPASGSAKSCIFINLIGGPSHLDTFDPKPDAPSDVRGPFRPIPTKVPRLYLSELFPKLAKIADKFSLIRSMHHDAPPIHESGLQLLNTGRLFRDGPDWPSMGTAINHVLPGTLQFPSMILPWNTVTTGINVGVGMTSGWLPIQSGPYHLPLTEYYPGGVSGNYWSRFGSSQFGNACGFGAGAVHHGTARFVTINQFDTVFDSPSWDCHADRGSLRCNLNDYRDTVAPMFDTAFSTLLTRLEERGLLESTLVVATGEFGRTPKLNANGGRDHWANCWTALVAGGGVKGGRILGASDATGSEPKDRPVSPQELVATVFHALGIPPNATIPGPHGSPVNVYPAKPIMELF